MKIPIKYAIDSNSWFECNIKRYKKYTLTFRLKLLLFQFIELNSVEDIEERIFLKELLSKHPEAKLAKLKIEVINLTKEKTINEEKFIHCIIPDRIVIIDHEDFVFNALELEDKSYFDYELKRFLRTKPLLKPKIKATGSILFILPNEPQAEYFVSVKERKIKEI